MVEKILDSSSEKSKFASELIFAIVAYVSMTFWLNAIRATAPVAFVWILIIIQFSFYFYIFSSSHTRISAIGFNKTASFIVFVTLAFLGRINDWELVIIPLLSVVMLIMSYKSKKYAECNEVADGKKEEKKFTVIYPCQFCGRLINYAFTPCIFCGIYPKTKKEAVVAHLLSSSSLVELDSILGVSKAIKDHANLDTVIGNFRKIVNDTLENKKKSFEGLYRMVELAMENENQEKLKGANYVKRSHIVCNQCGEDLFLADKPCYNCALKNQDNGGYPIPDNSLRHTEKQIIAMNNILLFIENHLYNAENKVGLEDFILISVYIINRLIEKDVSPNDDLVSLWKKALNKTHTFWANFGGEEVKGTIKIENNSVQIEMLEKCSATEQLTIKSFGSNLTYLLES
jgi:Ca2+/Na+ antiporter